MFVYPFKNLKTNNNHVTENGGIINLNLIENVKIQFTFLNSKKYCQRRNTCNLKKIFLGGDLNGVKLRQ